MLANHPSNSQNIALLKLQVSLQDCSSFAEFTVYWSDYTSFVFNKTCAKTSGWIDFCALALKYRINFIPISASSGCCSCPGCFGLSVHPVMSGIYMVYCNDPSPLVLSQDLIQRVYRFQRTCILKAICARVGFGSGTETTSPQALNWVKWLLTINSRPPHITVDLCRNFIVKTFL